MRGTVKNQAWRVFCLRYPLNHFFFSFAFNLCFSLFYCLVYVYVCLFRLVLQFFLCFMYVRLLEFPLWGFALFLCFQVFWARGCVCIILPAQVGLIMRTQAYSYMRKPLPRNPNSYFLFCFCFHMFILFSFFSMFLCF